MDKAKRRSLRRRRRRMTQYAANIGIAASGAGR